MTHTAQAVLSAFAVLSLNACHSVNALKSGTLDSKRSSSDQGSQSGDAKGSKDGEGEDAKADQPAQVTGMFLACDDASGISGAPSAGPGQAVLGCAPVDDDGARVTNVSLSWSVQRPDGSSATVDVHPSDTPDWDAYLIFDGNLLGAATVNAVNGPQGVAASFVTASPPPPAPIDATRGVLCQAGFAALAVETRPGACPDGSVVAVAKDGWDLNFSCCTLPEPAALTADPAARNVARDGACGADEVQTGFADALRPLCTAIDTTRYATSGASPALYVNGRVGVGKDGESELGDLNSYLGKARRSDVCVCPDLRMVFAGGHTPLGGHCKDQCVLLTAKSEADPLGTATPPPHGGGSEASQGQGQGQGEAAASAPPKADDAVVGAFPHPLTKPQEN